MKNNFRKILQKSTAFVLALCLCAADISGILPADFAEVFVAKAAADTYEDLTYTVNNGEVTITDCATSATFVEIPIEIDDLPVTGIGDWAFNGCASLTSLDMPSSVTKIGDMAFSNCASLTSLDISASVTSIGSTAFNGCATLISLNVADDNEHYSSIDGVLFDKSGDTLVCYPAGKPETSYTIPDGVASIGETAFYAGVNLSSVIIPASVNTIGIDAFVGCSGFTIYGVSGSYANTYATSNGIPFETIGDIDYITAEGYNDNDYQKLVAFALRDDNLQKLGWALDKPDTWSGIVWNDEAEKRVVVIELEAVDYSGLLDLSDFTALTRLLCLGSKLTGLNVSSCTSLSYLDCRQNEITELNVSSCTSLAYLDCITNKLTELDVSDCTNLTFLECSLNQISRFAVSTPSSLEVLRINDNNIETIDIYGLTSLKEFGCSNNYKIKELDVSGLTSLETLGFAGNKIARIDLTGLTNLTSLFCSFNELAELDVSSLTSLKTLECTENEIKELDVSNLTNLTYLNCSFNQLTEINVSALVELEYFNISFNSLETLDISGLKNLKDFTCGYNFKIKELTVSTITSLVSLGFNSNQITEIDLTNFTNLKELNCSDNKLTELDMSPLTDLRLLNVAYNQLTELEIAKFDKLTYLACDNNQLSELDVSELINLTVIYCHGNKFTELDVSNLTKLEELHCFGNQLTELDVTMLPNLKKLDCSNNRLTQIDVSNNTLLKYFLCGFNLMEELPVIEDLENLNEVSIYYNFFDLEDPATMASIEKIQNTINKNNGWFCCEPQGRKINEDILDEIKNGKTTVNIYLQNGRVISIDPSRITSNARETDLNIDIDITNTGNQIDGIPANSIVIRPFDHGEFGFEISFIITAEELNAAKLRASNARLFHIDEDGNVVEDGRVQRNKDGSMTIGITRASYYVLSEEVPFGGIAPVYGDVNEDGNINDIDVVVLKRNLTGWKSVTINEINSDVDGNGTVQHEDVTVLKRYLAGWTVTQGQSE